MPNGGTRLLKRGHCYTVVSPLLSSGHSGPDLTPSHARSEPGTMLYKGMCIKSDSCRARTFAFRGECISTCPTGLYRSDLTCLPCSNIDAKAVSCNSTSALSWFVFLAPLLYPADLFSTLSTGRYKLALGKCVLRCPSGTYPAGANCPSCPVANSSCTSATSFTW